MSQTFLKPCFAATFPISYNKTFHLGGSFQQEFIRGLCQLSNKLVCWLFGSQIRNVYIKVFFYCQMFQEELGFKINHKKGIYTSEFLLISILTSFWFLIF